MANKLMTYEELGAELMRGYEAALADERKAGGFAQRGPFLFAGPEDGSWFVWRQEKANDTMAQRVAGPFATREEAEALLGPPLAR